MKKFIIICGIVLLFISLVLSIFYLVKDNGTMVIKTNQGEVVISDIYQKAESLLADDNLTLIETDDYIIEYYPKLNAFSIGLLNPDIEKARALAEEELLRLLEIKEDEACKLEVTEAVPHSVSPYYSGKIYSLSFCE